LNIFINDIWVKILKPEVTVKDEDFNNIIDGGAPNMHRSNLINHVLLRQPGTEGVDELFVQMDSLLPKRLLSVTIIARDYKALKGHIKSHFKIIKAAGGVVKKGKKILMIYRLGRWDLPKGKIEKQELPAAAAEREIGEECNIVAKTSKKICNTWHTYTMKKKKILKKTSWYQLDLIDGSAISPQTDEDIERVEWMGPKEVFHAMDNSYESIRFVLDVYFKNRRFRWDKE